MSKKKALTQRELSIKYQNVFSSEDGVTVLADILNFLGYFGNQSRQMSPELLSVANMILSRANVFDTQNVEDYVELMITNTRPKEEKDDNIFSDLR